MTERLSQEVLVEYLRRAIRKAYGTEGYGHQAYQQIKQALVKKVGREKLKEYAEIIDTDPHKCTEASLVGIFIEHGFEVEGE